MAKMPLTRQTNYKPRKKLNSKLPRCFDNTKTNFGKKGQGHFRHPIIPESAKLPAIIANQTLRLKNNAGARRISRTPEPAHDNTTGKDISAGENKKHTANASRQGTKAYTSFHTHFFTQSCYQSPVVRRISQSPPSPKQSSET